MRTTRTRHYGFAITVVLIIIQFSTIVFLSPPRTLFPTASADRLVGDFSVANATSVAVNPNTNKLYVGGSDGILTVFNGTTNQIITRSNLGVGSLKSIAVNPSTNRIYVLGDSLSVINGSNDKVIEEQSSVSGYDVAVNDHSNRIYVANSNLTVINGSSGRIIANVPIIQFGGCGCWITGQKVVANDLSNTVYVTTQYHCVPDPKPQPNRCPSTIAFLIYVNGTTNQLINTTGCCSDYTTPIDVAVDPLTNLVYLETGPCVLNGTTNQAICCTAWPPASNIAVNPTTNTVYADNGGNTLSFADGSNLNGSPHEIGLPVWGGTGNIAIDPKTNLVYVVGNGVVSVINGNISSTQQNELTIDTTVGVNILVRDLNSSKIVVDQSSPVDAYLNATKYYSVEAPISPGGGVVFDHWDGMNPGWFSCNSTLVISLTGPVYLRAVYRSAGDSPFAVCSTSTTTNSTSSSMTTSTTISRSTTNNDFTNSSYTTSTTTAYTGIETVTSTVSNSASMDSGVTSIFNSSSTFAPTHSTLTAPPLFPWLAALVVVVATVGSIGLVFLGGGVEAND